MSGTYLCQDILDDIRNAHACGISLELLAAQVGVSEDELRRLLGLPAWKQLPQQNEFDWEPQRAPVSER
jgi:hypothetical protein